MQINQGHSMFSLIERETNGVLHFLNDCKKGKSHTKLGLIFFLFLINPTRVNQMYR